MRRKDSVVRARIHADLKKDAERVLSRCGLEFSDAIRLFLQQVVLRDAIPFPVEALERPERRPAREHAPTPIAHAGLSGENRLLVRSHRIRGARVFGWPSGRSK